uniref:Uncharacterized protein n=1 Tax=Anguilla anguilla TaxID=7936 RepID=A0A0E9ULM9_ANGAN
MCNSVLYQMLNGKQTAICSHALIISTPRLDCIVGCLLLPFGFVFVF